VCLLAETESIAGDGSTGSSDPARTELRKDGPGVRRPEFGRQEKGRSLLL